MYFFRFPAHTTLLLKAMKVAVCSSISKISYRRVEREIISVQDCIEKAGESARVRQMTAPEATLEVTHSD